MSANLTNYAERMLTAAILGIPGSRSHLTFVRYLGDGGLQLGPVDRGDAKYENGKIMLPPSSCDRNGVTRIEILDENGVLLAWANDYPWGPIKESDETLFPLEIR